ncbi:MAG: hypothetical protein ACOCVZ_00300 [Gemmatimonadota bacterium]
MAATLDADERAQLQERLLELDGVLHAGINPRSGDLWVVREQAYEHGPIELAVRNRIATLGYDTAPLTIRVTLPTDPGPRRRVRFESVDRVEEHGRVSISVSLEWDSTVHTGTATGERGPAIELKTTGEAAVRALEALTDQELGLRIIGVKPIHAFDSDLMVASVVRSGAARQPLVGAVVVTGQPLEAAALAVLSALNRTLGNFLHTTD